jgi:hypothetical protein
MRLREAHIRSDISWGSARGRANLKFAASREGFDSYALKASYRAVRQSAKLD